MEQQLLGYEHTLYRLDQAEHIVEKLDRVAPQILRTRRNSMRRPVEEIMPDLRRAGFEHVAYIVEFKHDWSLASALIKRWRPESHTFHLPWREMTITLQGVTYQLGLTIDGDPVGGCIDGWEQHHDGWSIENFFQQLLGAIPDLEDKQELEQDVIEERLLRYRRGYIMQVIGGILFPNASDSRVHIRWLPLLEDHDRYGRLSWGLAVLAWLYCQMCRAMKHSQRNLGGCISLLLSWAYLHIPLLWPVGFDTRRFLLVERWVEYRLDNAKGEHRLRHYRRMLNGIGILNVDWTPYAGLHL
ncbi:protein MAIN-LIKE 1-like [Arachis hypogaea]|uniref:protein MAIN-LIKE 1-like n=1 Tax=Arachis hypogaea TaxID=3818 RepID=UPI000DEC97BD|nr:protein MAIN-LIKE 1-like [Arachis hypogaea]